MKVMKFGGTSVGSAQRMKDVCRLVTADSAPKVVVLSAMSGTTNALSEIADYLLKKNPEGANAGINLLEQKYMRHIAELYSTERFRQKAKAFLDTEFGVLRNFTKEFFTARVRNSIVAQGEIMSTGMMADYMLEEGVKVCLLSALDFMRTDSNGEPDISGITAKFNALIAENPDCQVYLTQGFICRNAVGEIDNLQRGGSDYTASLLGAALGSEEIQIWTDIDGMRNNDPRYVENTMPVRQLNFDEAAELAYFGAKILHPTCILPAKFAGVPVRLLNTMDPSAPGTIINNDFQPGCIKAVAAKDNIISIQIHSGRMLLAYGFLRKVFEIFESYRTGIDMITTSEVGVSVTIDNSAYLKEIVSDLMKYGTVTVRENMCIVCVVGDLSQENAGFETLAVSAFKDIPVQMISYGGSSHNISFLVRGEDKAKVLRTLSDTLFNGGKA